MAGSRNLSLSGFGFRDLMKSRSESPSGLNSFHKVTEAKLGRGRSDSGWVTSKA